MLAEVHVLGAAQVDQQACDVHTRVEASLTNSASNRPRDCTGLGFAAADHDRLRA
jgi:hypothetical protein